MSFDIVAAGPGHVAALEAIYGYWVRHGLASFEEVRQALVPLRQAAKSLGCVLPEPFLQVAFLPLPVIPHLKITDRGLVDVDRFEIVREG